MDFPPSADEAWRLASYELFLAKLESCLLEGLGERAVDLRLEQGEDPASAEYEARLSAALDGEDKIIVGATIACELFRNTPRWVEGVGRRGR
jgi:hypothetical protein